MEVTLTQDAIINGRRYPAGGHELTKGEAESARALGVVAQPNSDQADPETASAAKSGGKKSAKPKPEPEPEPAPGGEE